MQGRVGGWCAPAVATLDCRRPIGLSQRDGAVEIGAWLRGMGLGRYEPAFRDNDVDVAVLRQLTAEDLVGLGVGSVGHRRKLLAAIAQLAGPSPAAGSPSAGIGRVAERRQLTVMFVDLVGSTALSARLDPEAMSALLRGYQNAVTDEIRRFEGHVAKFMGDGVLAYFGWPHAHEDDAERAVRAGLGSVAAVAKLGGGGKPLACRVGIATGLVVVGELVGEGPAQEQAVVGETPNLAARLQGLAKPGQVVVAESTRQLLGRLFELRELRSHKLKGIAEPVPAFTVLRAGRAGSRFEAKLGSIPPPMVGRDQELAVLVERWRQARAGEGQAVLVTGEAGIGKSRLLRGLRDAVADTPHTECCWQCSPFHQDSPLWPVTQDLLGNRAPTVAALERRFAGSGVDPARAVPLLAGLMGLAPGEGPRTLELGPEGERRELMLALLDHLLGLAARRPLLVLLEDAHWADATTLELARLLLERIGAAAILLVVTSRPEDLPALPAPSWLTPLTLGRLGRAEIAAIIARLAPDPSLAARLLDTVVRRTDGVPLFVEELTKTLAERGPSHDELAAGPDVPASLHDTLMARLDRQGEAKDVAQLAACIGREFEHRLLAAIADRPERELRRSLDQLCAAELLFRRGKPPDATYSFKHALVRDVAHESLLKGRRLGIHGRLLDAVERGVVAASAEETAYHAALAEQWAKALHHYGVAGKAAIARAAHTEGLGLIDRALAAGGRLAGDITAEVAMIDLRRVRSWAYLTIGNTPRMLAELRDAETRAARFGMTRLSCQLRAQRAQVESNFGYSARRAVRYGQEALRIAATLHDADLSAAARFALGHSLYIAGEYHAALAQLAHDAAGYRQGLRIPSVGSSGTLAVDGLALMGSCLGQLGRWDEAIAHGDEARSVATATGSPWDHSIANHHLARTWLARGDAASALPLIEWNIEFNQRNGLRVALPWQQALLGQAAMVTGRPNEAIDLLDQAIVACSEMQLLYTGAHALMLKAEACLAAGRADAGTVATEALELARARGYRAIEATALRLLATGALAIEPTTAQQHLSGARAIVEALDIGPELDAITTLERRLEGCAT